jgi:PAS domain-containing protein
VVLLPLGILLVGVLMPSALTPELSAIVGGFNAPYGAFHVLAQGMIRWWVAGATGTMLAVPAVVSWSLPALRRVRERTSLNCSAGLVALLAMLLSLFAYVGGRLAAADPRGLHRGRGLGRGAIRSRRGVGRHAVRRVVGLSQLYAASWARWRPIGIDEGITALWEFVVLVAAAAAVLTTLLAESENTERRLRHLTQRYRTLFDAVPHPLFAVSHGVGADSSRE